MTAHRPARRRLELDERRDELLAAARAEFQARSYDEVSLDQVAARAGASKALLYHYFSSKRALYTATVKQAAAELLACTEPDPRWAPDERLRRGLEAYLDYAERAGTGYVALLRGGVGVDKQVFEIVERTREKIVARALATMGLAKPPPALHVALRGWLGLVEAASLEYLRHRKISRDELVALMVRTAVAAVDGA